MAVNQVAFVQTTGEWQKLTDIISATLGTTFVFDSAKIYQFQVRSDVDVLFVESATLPAASSVDGNTLSTKTVSVGIYVPSTSDVYVKNMPYNRSLNKDAESVSYINITTTGE